MECWDENLFRCSWAMVLGSFQWRGVLLLLHIEGQGPAVLAPGAGLVGYIFFIFFFYIFHPTSLSNVLSFWKLAERDWNIVVSAVKPQL